MKDNDFVKKAIMFDEVSSTNSKARELALKGEDEGTIVVAKKQNKGRGRFDRVWFSPEGGLYLSVILRPNIPPDKTTLFPLIAALAVSKTINYFGLSSKIKWPNDVRINNRKVAGILLESETDENQLKFLVLGIGVNLNIDIEQFPKELKEISTSLSQELNKNVNYQDFLDKLTSFLAMYYKMFLNKDFDKILEEWRKLSDTIGRKVRIVTSSGEIIGKVTDVDESGFLIVITISGEHKKIMSGDCLYLDS